MVNLQLLYRIKSSDFIFLDIAVQILQEQLYGLNYISSWNKVLSLQHVNASDLSEPRLQLVWVLNDECQTVLDVLDERLSQISNIIKPLSVRESSLLILKANEIQGVNVHWVILEFDPDDVNDEADFAMLHERMRAELSIAEYLQAISVVEELLQKWVKTELLQLSCHRLLYDYRLCALLALAADVDGTLIWLFDSGHVYGGLWILVFILAESHFHLYISTLMEKVVSMVHQMLQTISVLAFLDGGLSQLP